MVLDKGPPARASEVAVGFSTDFLPNVFNLRLAPATSKLRISSQ